MSWYFRWTIFLSRLLAVFCSAAAPALCAPVSGNAKTTLAFPFVASPPSIDFGGQVATTTSTSRTITFAGPYDLATLTYNSVIAPPGFSLGSPSCAPAMTAGTCTVQVSFAPTTVGLASGNVVFTYLIGLNGLSTGVPVSGIGQPSLVPQYYQAILQRPPDPSGEAFWNGEAGRMENLGANVNEAWYAMAIAFFSSAEYASFGRDDAGFVTDLYESFLNRGPDAGGLSNWTGQIAQGMPRGVVLVSFMFNAEFQAYTQGLFGNTAAPPEVDITMDFYRGLLSRLPDDGGLHYWVSRFHVAACQGPAAVNGATDAISAAFATSPEYASRDRTNSEYVGDLYSAFLRRGADLPGVQFWIGQLDSGMMTRDAVRRAFEASAEFSARVSAIVANGCTP